MSKVGKYADMVVPGMTLGQGEKGSEALQESIAPDINMPEVPGSLAADPDIQKRVTQQVPDREKQLKQAAIAAGVTRSGNDADVLGGSGVKRRNAARTVLGSR